MRLGMGCLQAGSFTFGARSQHCQHFLLILGWAPLIASPSLIQTAVSALMQHDSDRHKDNQS